MRDGNLTRLFHLGDCGATARRSASLAGCLVARATDCRRDLCCFSSEYCCDGLDLYELSRVAEHRHPDESARRVVTTKVRPHDVPGGDQVSAVAAGHVNGRLHDILKTSTRGLECHDQVRHHSFSLDPDVADADDGAGLVEGAGTSSEDETKGAGGDC
jgi:hypothetical protein